jgi:hypothetical protein
MNILFFIALVSLAQLRSLAFGRLRKPHQKARRWADSERLLLGYRKRSAKDDRQNQEFAEKFGAASVNPPQMGWILGRIQGLCRQVPGE